MKIVKCPNHPPLISRKDAKNAQRNKLNTPNSAPRTQIPSSVLGLRVSNNRGGILKKYVSLVAVITLLLISCGGTNNGSQAGNDEKNVNLAPDFTLVDLDGNEHTLSNYRGKVVIIDFWATYCPPCRLEIPHFIQFYNDYKDDGLMILGIGLDGETKLKPFSKEFGINYPILIGDRATAMNYDVRVIPVTFILNKKGGIKKKIIGYAPGYEDTIKVSFQKLL